MTMQLVKPLLAQLLLHRCDAQQLLFKRIETRLCDDRGDCRLVGVLPDGSAFHQFEAGIPDAGKRLLQRPGLYVLRPGNQGIDLRQDGRDLVLVQGRRVGEFVLRQFHRVLGALAAGGLDLAELAMVAGMETDLEAFLDERQEPVTIYSHLQACGIINDHDKECPCYQRIISEYPTVNKRRDHEVK